jgi:pimeloyl-ACP methyl ester carboxylesterase
MLQEKTFDTGEVTLNYAEGPASGPPLILLHGLSGRWQGFLPLMPYLTTQWHVFALDQRGHGRSEHGGPYQLEVWSQDVEVFLQREISEPAVLIGCSLGGGVGLMAAARSQDRVRALVVGDFPVLHSGDYGPLIAWSEGQQQIVKNSSSVDEIYAITLGPLKKLMNQAQIRSRAKDKSFLDPEVFSIFTCPTAVRDRSAEANQIKACLPKISCPVLLVQAELMTDSSVEQALQLLPDGYHVRLENTGHDLGLATWELAPLLSSLMPFLTSL